MRNLKKLGSLTLALILSLTLIVPTFAAVEDTGFSDVDAGTWYAEAVVYCHENNLMNGIGENRFAPESSLTRAQLAMVLYNAAGSPNVTGTDAFTDTEDGAWYSRAVLWASQQNLVSGYGNGLFGTEDPVTREQMTAILWRYAGSPTSGNTGEFEDESAIAGYAVSAIDWASANNIVRTISNRTFGPKANATRAQVADALMNYTRNLNSADTELTPAEESKILIAYFSATNNTENIANHLNSILDADLYEIVPEIPYTSADLNYGNSSSRTSQEMNDSNARPAISDNVDNMEQYDVIFLGYPIWWGQAPRIISTFLESYDLSGKIIVPFCTSASSGLGSSASNLHSLASSANWLTGRRFASETSQKTIEDWISDLQVSLNGVDVALTSK